MPKIKTDDGVALHYEEAGSGTPVVFVHEFGGDQRSWEPQLRHFSRLLPLHRVQRTRLSALRRAGRLEPLLAGARARRHSQRARRPEDRARPYRRPLDGRERHAALRPHLSAARAFAHLRWRRLRLASGAHMRRFQQDSRTNAETHSEARHGAFRRHAMAIGPARVQFQNKDPRGFDEYLRQFNEHSALGSTNTLLGVQSRRPSFYDMSAELAKLTVPLLVMTGRRGRAEHRGERFVKRCAPDRGPRRAAEQRAWHQPRRAGALQPAAGEISSTRWKPDAGARATRGRRCSRSTVPTGKP